jgi:Tfp pilus assembly protein PilN
MIKINLAARKGSAVATSAGQTDAGTGQNTASTSLQSQISRLKDLQFNAATLGELKDLPIKRLGGVILIIFVANYLSSSFQADELKKLDDQLEKIATQGRTLKAELDKTKGFDVIKKSLEADELTMKTKIEVINKLLSDRQKPPKVLLGLSSIIPAEVWLSNFNLTQDDMKLSGYALNQLLVPEFEKLLGESADFKDVRVNSQTAATEGGMDVVRFDITAKRK